MSNLSNQISSPQMATSPPAQGDIKTNGQDASWGDRWKLSLFKIGTYFGINYVFNTLSSVALAYVFEMKYDNKLRHYSQKLGNQVSRLTGFSAEKQGKAFYEGTKGLTLTMGGTMLVPVLKTLEDHRQAIEFRIGHGLDVLQDKLGMANQSTQENLAEYKAIKTAIKTGKPVEGLSAEAKQLIGKQHGLNVDCDGKLSFKEHKMSWGTVLLARLAAWSAAFGTNYTFSHIGLMQKLDESKSNISKVLTSKIPAYGKLKQPDVFSKNLANDAFLCVSASVTQPFAQKVFNNKASRRAAALEQQKANCPDPNVPTPPDDSTWAKGKVDALKKLPPQPAENHLAGIETTRSKTTEQQSLA